MKSNCCLSLLIAILFSSSPTLTFPNEMAKDQGIEALIVKTFDEFRAPVKQLKLQLGEVKFNNKEPTHVANGDPNLYINPEEMTRLTQGKGEKFVLEFIQFVLAHEIAHKLQFANYKAEVLNAAKGEGKIFLECNADILAGFLITCKINTVDLPALLAKPGLDLNAYNQDRIQTYTEVYERIFNMDKGNPFIVSHPSNLQRLMAAKTGASIGNCFNLNFIKVPTEGPDLQYYNTLKNQIQVTGKGLGLDEAGLTNFNPLLWANGEAIRITNENNSVARNLTRYGVQVKKVNDRQTGDRYFNYSFKIYNANNFSVRLAGRIYTETKYEHTENDDVQSVPFDANNFDQIIAANDSILLSGSLINVNAKDFTTRLVLPGDKKSLYFAFNAQKEETDPLSKETSEDDFSMWDDKSLDNIIDQLNKLILDKDRFSSLTKGIGTSRSKYYGDIIRSGQIEFQPTFKEGPHDDQKFVRWPAYNECIYKFRATISKDSSLVIQHSKEIVQKITIEFQDRWKAKDSTSQYDLAKTEFLDERNHKAVEILVERDYDANYYVLISIYGK